MGRMTRVVAVLSMGVLAGCGMVAGATSKGTSSTCAAPGQWVTPEPGGTRVQAADTVLASLAQQQVVLLGETHDDPEHHRWQLHTIAALHGLRPKMVLGFEMFPRRVQPVLDNWVAGRLSDAEFLTPSDWQNVWGYDWHLYLSIFQFARMHRVPMLALNVERTLVTRVGDEGWAAILNLAIKKGEMVALVGPSGAGKTTLLNLLPRFYEVSRGAILIDGTDIRDVTLASLRAQIGVVTQQTILFNNTVRFNVAYGRPGATETQIIEAISAANAYDFVMALPETVDTVVGEIGVRLSGGEQQRLAIARALLKDPPILILDEATPLWIPNPNAWCSKPWTA